MIGKGVTGLLPIPRSSSAQSSSSLDQDRHLNPQHLYFLHHLLASQPLLPLPTLPPLPPLLLPCHPLSFSRRAINPSKCVNIRPTSLPLPSAHTVCCTIFLPVRHSYCEASNYVSYCACLSVKLEKIGFLRSCVVFSVSVHADYALLTRPTITSSSDGPFESFIVIIIHSTDRDRHSFLMVALFSSPSFYYKVRASARSQTQVPHSGLTRREKSGNEFHFLASVYARIVKPTRC